MGGQIRTEKQDGLGWILFDHPERRNAITTEMWREIPAALSSLEADPEVRVVVMRGAGDVAFVSGADISEFQETRTGDAAVAYEELNGRAFTALAEFPKPLIAMIHGFCVGGGMAISLHADLRYAADDARFGVPAARLGLGYPLGGIDTLLQLLGPARAKELFFTAKRINAEQALSMGLVNAVVPKTELEAHVRELATGIAENAPLTLHSAKLAMRELGKRLEQRNLDAVRESILSCFSSEDYQEGVRAFLEKRPPRFHGR